FEEGGLENSAAPVERVACKPDELRPAKAQAPHVLHLVAEFFVREHVGEPDRARAVDNREGHARRRKVLPDELEHEQFVEVCVEKRADDRVQFPVMVVGPLGEVDDHRVLSSSAPPGKATGQRAALRWLISKGCSSKRCLETPPTALP